MKTFLIDWWVELVIDRHINLKLKVKTKILQGSPIYPIFSLIYISGVLILMETELS